MRREKTFGMGRPLPLDRNAKARIMAKARALTRRTIKGKHYGTLTAKFLAVLKALLWKFHNAKSGLCFPSLLSIAEAAGCCEATVTAAIKALEACGLLSWVNRLKRVRDDMGRSRVVRTSNGYRFSDPGCAENLAILPNPKLWRRTKIQENISSETNKERPREPDPASLDLTGVSIPPLRAPIRLSPTLRRMLGLPQAEGV